MRRFDDWMEGALYAPGVGFYERGGSAGGARGDFITSPEVGPLFGAVVAAAVLEWTGALGLTEPTVVEVGAGRGTLARSMIAAGLPEGARHVLVERSAPLRAAAAELLGDRVEVRADLPPGPIDGIVIANELLDNLPCRIVERTASGWAELWVRDGSPTLVEVDPSELPDRVISSGAAAGDRLPVLDRAARWVHDVRGRVRRGRVLVVDYGTPTTAELLGRDWLRTYAGQQRGNDPFAAPAGAVDITIDVPFDQLPPGATLTTQAEILRRHGIEALVDEGRRTWHERAHIGDLAAVTGRSRVNEAEALLDPTGLGGFLVAEYAVSDEVG